jgi:recombination protein RecR
MKLPRAVQHLTEQFEKMPGIGPRSAQRIALYLLHVPDYVLDEFSKALVDLKPNTVLCERCHLIGETSPCDLCQDEHRSSGTICVVEQPLDVIALEQSKTFAGRYHVLHGVIAPLENIGPDQLFLRDLVPRISAESVQEVILATNPTMEGEATALYIEKLLRDSGFGADVLRVTRIGHGLPVGADIEYADGLTLARAMEGRRDV